MLVLPVPPLEEEWVEGAVWRLVAEDCQIQQRNKKDASNGWEVFTLQRILQYTEVYIASTGLKPAHSSCGSSAA